MGPFFLYVKILTKIYLNFTFYKQRIFRSKFNYWNKNLASIAPSLRSQEEDLWKDQSSHPKHTCAFFVSL